MSFRPSQLNFSQTSISPYFSNGNSIHIEIDRIKNQWNWNRQSEMDNFLPLEIRKDNFDDKWYCNNNRRLYMFRVLEKQGYVTNIAVRHGGMRPKDSNAGCHIQFRGTDEKPLAHCPCGDACTVM